MLQRIAGLVLLGALLSGPVAAQAPAAEAEPQVSPDKQKQITKLETRIRGLLNRIQAIDEELAKLPKDPPGIAQPAGGDIGMVQPGPEGAPAMGPDGMPMEGGMEAAVPMTRRGRLELEKKNALAEVFKLRAELKKLKDEDTVNPLEADNVAELHPMILYGGKLDKNPFGLKVGSWGSGVVEEAEEGMLEGLQSLLLYTDGYYRGMKFDFATAPDLTKYFGDPKRAYLEMDIVFFPKKEEAPVAGGESGLEGSPEGSSSEMMPDEMNPELSAPMEGGSSMMPGEGVTAMEGGGSMMPGEVAPALEPGMEGGMMEPGTEMGMTPAAAAKPAPPATRSLRVVLDTDRGPAVAEDVWFDHLYQVYPGWTRVFIPLTDFRRTEERAPEKLNRIRLFGDTTDAFYIGQVRLVSDEVPITPVIVGGPRIDAVAGEELMIESYADAGLSVLNYAWDFGDGEKDETKVSNAEHIYVKPGEYTVTLTASDADGLKPPGTVTATVVVKAYKPIPRVQPGMVGPGGSSMPAPE